MNAREIASPVLSDVRSTIKASLVAWSTYDETGVPLWGNLREPRRSGCHARVLCRDCHIRCAAARLTPASAQRSHVTGQTSDIQCRGQWQSNAPAILPVVRDAALSGQTLALTDLCPRRHFRRSISPSCDDDLDVICAPRACINAELPQVVKHHPRRDESGAQGHAEY